MKEFDFIAPRTVEEFLPVLDQYKEKAEIVAGGTDIVLEFNERKLNPEVVLDVKKLKELDYIRVDEDYVHIGAVTSHATIAANEYIKENVVILATACGNVGSPQIRNLGTIGGNIATSSVAGDGLCAVLTLDASVVLKSVEGTRVMKLSDFLNGEGYKKINALKANELLTEVFFEKPDKHTATAFYKLGKRKALAISMIGGGMVVKVDDEGICTFASLRAGALGRYPLQLKAAEEFLVGKKLTMDTMMASLPIIHDIVYESAKTRPSVIYKKEAVQGVFHGDFQVIEDQLNKNMGGIR
ncbi:MAG: FAD binding domain-containing protein [Lachnospiraceae bacterium]|nr:FAD binding domain-containing protein [Lachnospiraceae bacterium]